MADPIPLPELITRVRALMKLGHADAVKESVALLPIAKASLQAFADEQAHAGSRDMSNVDFAREAEISVSQLENRIRRHNRKG